MKYLRSSFPGYEIKMKVDDPRKLVRPFNFPGYEIKMKVDDPRKLVRPFKLTFENVLQKQQSDEAMDEDELRKVILVEPHVQPRRGPYLYNEPKKNNILFTPTQVEAIRSGMQPGLTLVVGPPGTGKTDVAVQIISNLYHNFPWQRTLVVTHSNQALNQLFEKVAELDVDERHLLRLGHGEEALQTDKDFSRYGRVNYVLAKRLELLELVGRLQQTLDAGGDAGATCELAHHFHVYHVKPRCQAFLDKCQKEPTVETIQKEFPFHEFFDDAPKPLFPGNSFEEDMEIARSCFRYVNHIFEELEEFRAFELLRSGLDRSKYLLVKEAKIIAMTCTHAALKRAELVQIVAFELLRSGLDRSKYLLVKEAKIIAMTCTHAALKRAKLVQIGLDRSKYLLVKEAKIIAMTCTRRPQARQARADRYVEYMKRLRSSCSVQGWTDPSIC
ncbi:AAA domain-containing protein [Phthorimaea operculella]|nr:AAA domain-containing protein [Phthorimaea operculella]